MLTLSQKKLQKSLSIGLILSQGKSLRGQSTKLHQRQRKPLSEKATSFTAQAFCFTAAMPIMPLPCTDVHRSLYGMQFSLQRRKIDFSTLKESKVDVQELYVKNMRQTVACHRTLKGELTEAFKTSHKALASKLQPSALSNAVAFIAVCRILNTALNSHKQSAGYFLACVRSISNLQLSKDGFGEKYHTPSSEPYYYDQSYAQVERKAAIPVDSKGRCIVAGVIERAASGQVQKWRCTAECKLPNTEARESIAALKVQFDGSRIPDLRQALDGIDGGCPYQHFSTPYTRKQKGKREYNADCTRELKGQPLPCAQEDSGYLSTLRILRAAAPHYPRLRKLLQHVYEALRLHRLSMTLICLCAMETLSSCAYY